MFCKNWAHDQNNSWQQCLKEPNAVTSYQQTDKIMLSVGLSPEKRFQVKSLNQNQRLKFSLLCSVWGLNKSSFKSGYFSQLWGEEGKKAILSSQISVREMFPFWNFYSLQEMKGGKLIKHSNKWKKKIACFIIVYNNMTTDQTEL